MQSISEWCMYSTGICTLGSNIIWSCEMMLTAQKGTKIKSLSASLSWPIIFKIREVTGDTVYRTLTTYSTGFMSSDISLMIWHKYEVCLFQVHMVFYLSAYFCMYVFRPSVCLSVNQQSLPSFFFTLVSLTLSL